MSEIRHGYGEMICTCNLKLSPPNSGEVMFIIELLFEVPFWIWEKKIKVQGNIFSGLLPLSHLFQLGFSFLKRGPIYFFFLNHDFSNFFLLSL